MIISPGLGHSYQCMPINSAVFAPLLVFASTGSGKCNLLPAQLSSSLSLARAGGPRRRGRGLPGQRVRDSVTPPPFEPEPETAAWAAAPPGRRAPPVHGDRGAALTVVRLEWTRRQFNSGAPWVPLQMNTSKPWLSPLPAGSSPVHGVSPDFPPSEPGPALARSSPDRDSESESVRLTIVLSR
jgi:hypothetical protein